MRSSRRCGGWTAVLLMAAGGALGQTGAASGMRVQMVISAPASGQNGTKGEILREIDDPHNGDCWLLERDPAHPGGPGRLVLASAGQRVLPGRLQPAAALDQALPVIRSGDRVVVEEHSAQADARLEAVAMGPAMAGASFSVRLTIGGQVMRVVALAAGHAAVSEATR